MKQKGLIKLVYRLNHDSLYVRYTPDGFRSLNLDFPVLAPFHPQLVDRITRCDFATKYYIGKAWIDKHGNVIVRCMSNNLTQTKINF